MPSRYWVRFYTPNADDPRPVKVPAPEWWCTGYTGDGDRAVVCCLLLDDGSPPLERIREFWPEVEYLDSVTECEPGWRPPSDRFPPLETPKEGT